MRLVLTAAVLAALAGCNATMPQRQVTADDDPAKTCFETIPTNPRWASLGQHIPLADPRHATTQMLADSAKPSEDERNALSQWANARKLCADIGVTFRQRYAPPGVAGIYEQYQMTLLQTIASLYAGDLTYGQFNTARQRQLLDTRASFDSLHQRHTQERATQQAQQQNQALQNMQMLQLMQAMQPRPPQLPMPSLIQPTVNCISRPSLGSVYTTCN